MKILVLLFILIAFLDSTSGAIPIRPAAPGFRHVRVYVHMNDDRVFFGFLRMLNDNRAIPVWALHPNEEFNREERVYIRLPSGRGAVANLQPFEHGINVNDALHEKHRCFLPTGDGTLLVAVLHPYDPRRERMTSRPRVFIRMPDDNTVYIGEFGIDNGHRSSWLQ